MVSEQGDRTQVLDHGYVQLVETWGSDERIVEAARMSTAKGFQGWGPVQCSECVVKGLPPKEPYLGPGSLTAPEYVNVCKKCNGSGKLHGDEKLLRYLYEHKHMTPFEMAGMTIEVQAPIFVFREWHRHRTQSYNELSARYTPLPDVNYLPTVERLMMSGGVNKQAQGTGAMLTEDDALFWQHLYREFLERAQALYQHGLDRGLPKELARLPIPVARYSRMRASANLRNWLQFLTLRMDPAAQWEIRQYANAVAALIEASFPRTYELFKG